MTGRGAFTRTKLSRHIGRRRANDLAALALVVVALGAAGTLAAAVFFWSGWVAAAFVLPAGWFAARWLATLRLGLVTREVEREFPVVDGRLLAALQLAEYRPDSREGYSDELVRAAIDDVEAALRPLALDRLVRRRRVIAAVVAVAAALGALAGYLWLAPTRARLGLVNAFAPARLDIAFAVEPGDTAVLPGGEVVLRCRVRPAGVFDRILLETTGVGGVRRTLRLENGGAQVAMSPEVGFRYRFRLLGRTSDEYRIRVREPLELERVVFSYDYPDYTGLPDYRSASTEVVALKGTTIGIEGLLTQPAVAAWLVLGDDTLPLELGQDREIRGTFAVGADGEGRVVATDIEGGDPQTAGLFRVRTVADDSPLVRVLVPGRDTDLPASMQLLLVIHSMDDYGLGALDLWYGRDSSFRRIRVKSSAGLREDTTFYTWDLSGSDLLPGDAMSYYVEVADNDAVSGPNSSRSPVYQVRFPTMTEIYDAAVRQTEYTTEELVPLMEAQEELGEQMARLGEQMRSTGDLSWEERRAMEQVLADQTELAREIDALREEVSGLMEELSQGMTLDQETMERLGQLQELLSELLPQELLESLARLREKVEAQSGELREALERFELDQAELRDGIEQALEMLERIVEEQRLEELARRAQDLAATEADIAERLGAEPDDPLAELQDRVGAGLDSLVGEMAELAQSMSDSATSESLAALADEARQDSLSQLAEATAGMMRQGRGGQAKQLAGSLAQKLDEMAQTLAVLSAGLKGKRSGEVARRMLEVADQLLMVSRLQEELESGLTPGQLDDRAVLQMSLHDGAAIAAESLAALGARTPGVPPAAPLELARAMQAMSLAAQALVDDRAAPARQQMGAARERVNGVAAMLLDAAQRQQQGTGMGGGLQGLMQQLSQMTAEQMAANAAMGGIPIPVPGGLSPAQLQALGRVLSQQRAVREKLEQLLQSMSGSTPGLTSSLEGLLDEMRAVEQDLSELNVNRELVERQEGLLSHLLDVQRSVRQRGYKEQRESEAARPFDVGPDPRLPVDLGERNRLLREELMRAMREQNLGGYEGMVREYFERLLTAPPAPR